MKKFTISIDLGATKILLGILDQKHNIIFRKQILTEKEKGFENALGNTVALIESVLGELSIKKEQCKIGICAPGPINVITGQMLNSVNFDWGFAPLRDVLAERTGIPVVLDHDAKVSAIGEYKYGMVSVAGVADKKLSAVSDMVYIVVGSGVGGAIIINNKIYRGQHNYAGEVGHITLDFNGDPGATEIKGNAQSYMSGPSLIHFYKKFCKEAGVPLPKQKIDGKLIGDLANNKDPIALKVIEQAGKALGVLIGSLAMVLDIDLFVVGSSVVKIGDLFLDYARAEMPKYAFAEVANNVKIVASTLGDDAALLGCYHIANFGI